MKNINNMTSKELTALADLILANPNTSAEQIAAIQEALATNAENERIERDYARSSKTADKKFASRKANATKKSNAQKLNEAKVGCSSLIDSISDSVAEERHETPDDKQKKELTEATNLNTLAITFNRVSKDNPDDGQHLVNIVKYSSVKKGYNGEYITVTLTTQKENGKVEWNKHIPLSDLSKVLNDIDYENKALLSSGNNATGSVIECLDYLKTHSFLCWTVMANDKLCTYFNNDAYRKYVYVLKTREAERLDRAQDYADKKAAGTQKKFATNGNRKVGNRKSN